MEKNLKRMDIYIYIYIYINWIPLLYTWNIVNQLYSNKKIRIKNFKLKYCLSFKEHLKSTSSMISCSLQPEREPSKSSLSSVQFSHQSCPTLCDPMNRSTPGLPVHHQLPEFSQTNLQLLFSICCILPFIAVIHKCSSSASLCLKHSRVQVRTMTLPQLCF